MCHTKKIVCVCFGVIEIFEREKLLQITNPTTVCISGVLLASNGENVVLRPNNIFLKAHFLRYQLYDHLLTDIFVHYGSMCNFFFIDAQGLKYRSL